MATMHERRNTGERHTLYILSSPSGPQALLLSPGGTYTAPWPALTGISNVHSPPGLVGMTPGAETANVRRPPQLPRQAIQQIVARGQDLPEEQQANVPRDIVRIMIPLGGHIWLLIRLLGFVWFFTHGASWRRIILLNVAALLLFLAQIGAFRPVVRYVWEPIQRHAQALLPLAAHPQDQAIADAANRQAPNPGTTGQAAGITTPEQAAERLLQQQRQRGPGILRQTLLRAERAIALFVASLVPGVGERHVAARRVADEFRLREREEIERREQEERRQEQEQQQQSSSATTGATTDVEGLDAEPSGEPGSASTQSQQAAPEQPLVEI